VHVIAVIVRDEHRVDLRQGRPRQTGGHIAPEAETEAVRHHRIDEHALAGELNQEAGVSDPCQAVARSSGESTPIVGDDGNLDPRARRLRSLFIVEAKLPAQELAHTSNAALAIQIREAFDHSRKTWGRSGRTST